MAKVALTKLGLKPNTETKSIDWNGQSVEVRQCLTAEEKLTLITRIINNSMDENPYYNSARVSIYTRIEMILAYTNINVTEKQREDVFKLYDLFSSELGNSIIANIPVEESNFINAAVKDVIEGIYKYKNSAMGIMEIFAKDYTELGLDIQDLQKQLGDNENMELLRNVLSKLG